MSSSYESNGQTNSSVDALLRSNRESVETFGLTPYQPIIYAIPEEQRQAEYALLQRAAEFQPTLYRMLEPLATKEELQSYARSLLNAATQAVEQTADELATGNNRTVAELEQSIRQAGRQQEKFISDSSSLLDTRTKELDGVIDSLRRKLLRIQIWTSVSAAALSALVSVVLWQLLN